VTAAFLLTHKGATNAKLPASGWRARLRSLLRLGR
jgi:hypothetical protein